MLVFVKLLLGKVMMMLENEVLIFLREIRPFLTKALPTHLNTGGEADRQKLLKKLDTLEQMIKVKV